MANLIKQKFLEGIDSTKFKVAQNGAIIAIDSQGNEVEILRLDANNKALVLGEEKASKSGLAQEILDRIAGDVNLQNQINNIISNTDPAALDSLAEIVAAFQSADGNLNNAITTLGTNTNSAIAAEAAARAAADTGLAQDIADEASAREAADAGLAQDIADEASAREAAVSAEAAARTAAISAEATARADADAGLAQDLADEEAARIAGDVAVQAAVNAEASRAMAVEAGLAADIADETSAREAAVSAEAAARADADAGLAQDLADEEAARIAGDVALDARLDIVEPKVSTLETGLAQEILNREAGDAANLLRISDLESFAVAQTIYVSKNGNDTTGTGGQHKPFLTLTKAFAMITDASPTKRYVVRVAAGAYTEASVALPSNVFVIGEQKETVRITGAVSMGAWTQDNSGSDDRSGFSMVTLLSAANFNWQTAKSRAGKLYMNEVVFASTLNLYGYDNAIAQAQFDSCVIFGAVTISGINVGVFSNNVCYSNVTLNQHPNGGMASILAASGGYCSGTVRFNTTVNDFGRRSSGFLRAFPSENLIVDGSSSYVDADLISQGKSSTQKLNSGNLVALNPRISHDLETQMIKPISNNAHNMGDWGKQFMFNFGYVHASSGSDLYLSSLDSSYDAAGSSAGYAVNIESDGYGLKPNVNGGDINLTTGAVSGTGVRGKIKFDGREIDASSKKITNLADGTDSSDAVNKSQLDAEVSRAQAAEAGLAADIVAEESRAMAAEAGLATDISDEEARAMTAEAGLQSAINAEAAAREADVNAEESRAMAVEAGLAADLAAEVSRATAAEATLATSLAGEAGLRESEDQNLQSQINNILSNTDPAALDSLTEVVAAFQSADGDLNNAITALGTASQSALAAEITRATAAEGVLAAGLATEVSAREADVNSEESRAMAVEAGLQSAIDAEIAARTAAVSAEESRAMAAEAGLESNIDAEAAARTAADTAEAAARAAADTALQSAIDAEVAARTADVNAEEARALAVEAVLASDLSNLDGYAQDIRSDLDQEVLDREADDVALSGRLDAIEAIVWEKHSKVLDATDIANGYVTLPSLAVANSMCAYVGHLAIHEGASDEYSLSVSGGVTRVTFQNALVVPGPEALVAGDKVYFKYQK